MIDIEELIACLDGNSRAQISIEAEILADASIAVDEVAERSGREFREERELKTDETGALAFYRNLIVFQPKGD